ncbi:Unknown protein, partial [Striga hermonthica]
TSGRPASTQVASARLVLRTRAPYSAVKRRDATVMRVIVHSARQHTRQRMTVSIRVHSDATHASSVSRVARMHANSVPRILASYPARQHAQQRASDAQQASASPGSTSECPVSPARIASVPVAYPRRPAAPNSPSTRQYLVALFRDYHPEKFSGQGDPRVVDEWVQGLEIIFEVMNSPDRYRMLCAQIQLTGDARLWWQAYWSMRPGDKDGCTWDQFKELIREKYYPSYYHADMERQFLALTQGTRTVDEYEREFTRLGAFLPDLV